MGDDTKCQRPWDSDKKAQSDGLARGAGPRCAFSEARRRLSSVKTGPWGGQEGSRQTRQQGGGTAVFSRVHSYLHRISHRMWETIKTNRQIDKVEDVILIYKINLYTIKTLKSYIYELCRALTCPELREHRGLSCP